MMFSSNLVRPAPDINYNFITAAYGLGTLLAVFLFVLQRILSVIYIPNKEVTSNTTNIPVIATSESLREFTQSLQGLYLIFVPFFPCFLWSVWIRRMWLSSAKTVGKDLDKKNE
jgi:hypothetical protein